jgi:hypothetical protein
MQVAFCYWIISIPLLCVLLVDSRRTLLLEDFSALERRDMEPFNNGLNGKRHTRVFGIPRDHSERQHRSFEVTGDTTAWYSS